jgi:hypothetical protein
MEISNLNQLLLNILKGDIKSFINPMGNKNDKDLNVFYEGINFFFQQLFVKKNKNKFLYSLKSGMKITLLDITEK